MGQDIIEGNKLIAEFMGGGYKTVYWGGEPVDQFCLPDKFDGSVGDCLKFLEYHSSWDWLMPVVEKIGDIYIHADEKLDEMVKSGGLHIFKLPLCSPTLKIVWEAAVEFIKWYNSNK